MGAVLGDMFTAIAVQGEQTKIIDACMRQKGYRVEIKKTN